jgi:hypothetical protein
VPLARREVCAKAQIDRVDSSGEGHHRHAGVDKRFQRTCTRAAPEEEWVARRFWESRYQYVPVTRVGIGADLFASRHRQSFPEEQR